MSDSDVATRPRASQAERVANSRERLLDAAATLFVEHGYHATTAGDIATRAGYSREMVRVRFGSKLGLAQTLIRIDYRQSLEIERTGEMSGIDVLRAKADRLAELGRTAPIRVRAAFVLGFESATSARELEPEFGPWMTLVEAHFVADVERAIADGSARNVDATRTGQLLMTAATGGAYTALRSGDTAAAADAFQTVLDLIANDPRS
ncbi:TetR/AcrR family transcriptional regulator [Ilumatobacter nonamiensis]|uniref:TetR/AcrR family transcriptional regulator n=1 Tax=Ilumatobacter nonamiensis TaxID=467093 RepID=UPI0003486CE9|nr:TetR/AcrR family transcriptional regulator [Ilumatobacter nonamiensis]